MFFKNILHNLKIQTDKHVFKILKIFVFVDKIYSENLF